jgi:hypothetical protein
VVAVFVVIFLTFTAQKNIYPNNGLLKAVAVVCWLYFKGGNRFCQRERKPIKGKKIFKRKGKFKSLGNLPKNSNDNPKMGNNPKMGQK